MKYATGIELPIHRLLRAQSSLFGESTDADDPFGLQGGDDSTQMRIAGDFHDGSFGGGELVRCVIAATGLDEHERAVVGNEVVFEKGLRCAETLRKQPPEPPAADFRLWAVEADDAPLRVLAFRFAHGLVDAHPVAHGGDLAKGHAGLSHAKRSGVHADEDDTFGAAAKAPQIRLVRRPGVIERLIHIFDRRGEAQRSQSFTQGLGGGDQGFGRHHGMRCVEHCHVKPRKKNSYPQTWPILSALPESATHAPMIQTSMTLPRSATLLVLLLASALSAAAADRLEQWYNLMPKDTVGIIAIKNTPELLADWDQSSHAKFMQDDAAQRWMAPMRKSGDTPWDAFFKDAYGTGMYDTLQGYPGAVVSFLVINDVTQLTGNPPNVSLCEVAGKQQEIEARKAAEVTAKQQHNADLKLRTEDIGGVTVNIAAASGAADAPWTLAWAVVGDVLIEANTRTLMAYMIGAVKNGAADPPGAAREHLARIGKHTNSGGDAMIYFNGEKLLGLGQQALAAGEKKAKDEPPNAAAALGLDFKPQQIMDLLGAQELQAIALTLEMTDTQSRMDMTILHPLKPTGLLSIMRGSSGAVTLPAFMPADLMTGSVGHMSLGHIYDTVLGMVAKLGPMAMMATMQIGTFEQQLGFKIRDDLFGSLDDEFVQAQDGADETASQVIGFKIKDAEKLGVAINGLKTFIGAGFGAFEESDHLGFTVNTLKMATDASATTAIAYCNTGSYLLISTGPPDTLKKVLARMKSPDGPSLWDNARTQNLITRAPKNYNAISITDAGRLINMLATAAAALESQSGGKKAQNNSAAGGWFDADALPANDVFQRYFGSMLSTGYAHPDAIQVHYLIAPVAAP